MNAVYISILDWSCHDPLRFSLAGGFSSENKETLPAVFRLATGPTRPESCRYCSLVMGALKLSLPSGRGQPSASRSIAVVARILAAVM